MEAIDAVVGAHAENLISKGRPYNEVLDSLSKCVKSILPSKAMPQPRPVLGINGYPNLKGNSPANGQSADPSPEKRPIPIRPKESKCVPK